MGAGAEEPLHESDYAVKLGAVFFETSEEANKTSQAGRYAEAAAQWASMIAAEEPSVPAAMRPVVFAPARAALAELNKRAELTATPTAANLRALFRSVVKGAELVEHAELGDARLPALVERLLAVDAEMGQLLAQPFQVVVDPGDLSETERKALLDQTLEALQKLGLKGVPDAPLQADKRVLTLKAKHGKTTAAPPVHHGMKLPPGAKSCGVDIAARLTQSKATLLELDLSARGVFGVSDQCAVGPLRLAAEAAPFRLVEAAMPKR